MRQGYANYIVYIVLILNTVTTLYYLAVKNIPSLQQLFPSFLSFGILSIGLGIPLTFIVGFWHYKRSKGQLHQIEIENIVNPLTPIILMTYKMLRNKIPIDIPKDEQIKFQKIDERVEYYLRRVEI